MRVSCNNGACSFQGSIYDLKIDERGIFHCPKPGCKSASFLLKADYFCKDCGWEGAEPKYTRMGGFVAKQCPNCGFNQLQVVM